jgi:hypothetical protein
VARAVGAYADHSAAIVRQAVANVHQAFVTLGQQQQHAADAADAGGAGGSHHSSLLETVLAYSLATWHVGAHRLHDESSSSASWRRRECALLVLEGVFEHVRAAATNKPSPTKATAAAAAAAAQSPLLQPWPTGDDSSRLEGCSAEAVLRAWYPEVVAAAAAPDDESSAWSGAAGAAAAAAVTAVAELRPAFEPMRVHVLLTLAFCACASACAASVYEVQRIATQVR